MQYDSINYQYTRLLAHAALPKLETFIFLPAPDGYQCVINEEFQRYLGFERNRFVGLWSDEGTVFRRVCLQVEAVVRVVEAAVCPTDSDIIDIDLVIAASAHPDSSVLFKPNQYFVNLPFTEP